MNRFGARGFCGCFAAIALSWMTSSAGDAAATTLQCQNSQLRVIKDAGYEELVLEATVKNPTQAAVWVETSLNKNARILHPHAISYFHFHPALKKWCPLEVSSTCHDGTWKRMQPGDSFHFRKTILGPDSLGAQKASFLNSLTQHGMKFRICGRKQEGAAPETLLEETVKYAPEHK